MTNLFQSIGHMFHSLSVHLASSVDAYKTADGWSAAASRIQAIPT